MRPQICLYWSWRVVVCFLRLLSIALFWYPLMPPSAGCAAASKIFGLCYWFVVYCWCTHYLFMFRQLVDDSLSRMAEACPLIEHLILSSCLSIGIDGLSSLQCLHKLTLLDLSYTFLINLKPVFDSCPQLKVGLIVILFRLLWGSWNIVN